MASILVVDDSALARRISGRILSSAGHSVIEATDGLTALEQYALSKPDLVLLDVTMLEMNGLEVLRQLIALDPAARVIMATADVQSSTRTLAIAGGAVGFIVKPFVSDIVLQTIATALAGEGAPA